MFDGNLFSLDQPLEALAYCQQLLWLTSNKSYHWDTSSEKAGTLYTLTKLQLSIVK